MASVTWPVPRPGLAGQHALEVGIDARMVSRDGERLIGQVVRRPPALGRDQTLLIWRKGVVSPKIRALKELLLEHSDLRNPAPAKRRRGNGHSAAIV